METTDGKDTKGYQSKNTGVRQREERCWKTYDKMKIDILCEFGTGDGLILDWKKQEKKVVI